MSKNKNKDNYSDEKEGDRYMDSSTQSILHCEHRCRTSMGEKTDSDENRSSLIRKMILLMVIELIGTTFFLFIGLIGSCSNANELSTLTTAVSFGLSLIIFLASFGSIGDVHLNPAVTIGVLVAGGLEVKKAVCYIIVQLIGGIMAAGIFRLHTHISAYRRCSGGATVLPLLNYTMTNHQVVLDRLRWWEGLSLEFLLTFVFVTTILMLTMRMESKSNLSPMYIGLALSTCILASNSLTGASLNPARSLGTAIFANLWHDHYIYWFGPILGGIVAGGMYRFVWNKIKN